MWNIQRYVRLLHTKKAAVWIPLLLFCAMYAAELLIIGVLNQGHFIYTLDDPYIHLALAENIAAGHYGVNLQEYSSPSSSILWPFILAPFSRFAIGQYLPLCLNFIAALGTLRLMTAIVEQAFAPINPDKRYLSIWMVVGALIAMTNPVSLAFMGMEHSLQVFLSVCLVAGMIHEQRTGSTVWWVWAAIILGPLLRYENLALSFPALIYLAWRRHYKLCGISAIILLGSLAGFSLFLYSMGLGMFPTSILAKSFTVSSGFGWLEMGRNFAQNLMRALGAIFCVSIAFFGVILVNARRSRAERGLACWICSAVVLHLFMGNIGWFSRYDMYIWNAVLLMLISLYADVLAAWIQKSAITEVVGLLSIAVIVVCGKPLLSFFAIPLASNNIYEQHYQMHRFVTEYYKRPVAVGDLGLVSYQNDEYVLDFAGLASQRALNFIRHGHDNHWMNPLAQEYHVAFAMLHAPNFQHIPQNWRVLGTLHLGKPRFAAAYSMVTFYAFDEPTFALASTLLLEFRKTLPAGVKFVFSDERGE